MTSQTTTPSRGPDAQRANPQPLTPLTVANVAVGLASSAFGALALARPGALDNDPLRSSPFYARMYAARAIPLGLAVAASSASRHRSSALLAAAAGAQAGDALIGLQRRSVGMTLSPLLGTVVHGALALAAVRERH